jgi:hypothetical protein
MGKKLLAQLQISDRTEDKELLTNGNLNQWSGGAPVGWTVNTTGGSTVTEETVDVSPLTGAGSAAKFTYDATPGAANIFQTKTAKKESFYYMRFWYTCEEYSASQNFKFLIRDSGTNVYLQGDGTWAAGIYYFLVPSCDNWTYFELKFLTHPDYTDYFFRMGIGSDITLKYFILDDLEVKLDTTFVAAETTTYNGAQYLGGLVNSQSISIDTNVAYKGELERSGLSIRVSKDVLIDNEKSAIGRNAIIREGDGSRIGLYKITDRKYFINETEYQLTDGFGELADNTASLEITEEAFPDAPESCLGTIINRFSGQFLVNVASDAGARNFLTAQRKKNRVVSTSDGIYIIGLSIQNIVSLQYVTTPDGTDVTSSCILVLPTASDPYHYISYSKLKTNEDYLKVHFTYPAISAEGVIDEIGGLLFSDYPFDTSDISGFLFGRNYNKLTGGFQDRTDPRFLLDKAKSYTEILKDICLSYNLSYYVNQNGNIVFKILDLNAPVDSGETETINDELASNFTSSGYESPYLDLTNQLSAQWGYDGNGSNQKNTTFDLLESQKRNDTTRNDSIELPLFPTNMNLSKRMADCTSRLWMLDKFYPQKKITFKIESISDEIRQGVTIDDLLIPMKIFAFRHIAFNDAELHYLQIRRISRVYPDDYATVQFTDISGVEKIDGNTSLLIQSDSDSGSLVILDRAPNGFHTINNNIVSPETTPGVKHDSSYPLFSSTTLTSNNAKPDLQIGLFGFYDDLHVFAALAVNGFASAEFSFWIRFNSSGNQEMILSQHVNATNKWYIYKNTSDQIRVYVETGGVVRLSIASTSTVADGKFHHVAFFRDDNNNGLYINGQQEAYSSASLNVILNVLFTVFNDGNSGNYGDFEIQDLAIALNSTGITDRVTGWFDLAPNIGLTNKFTVPWGLRSRYWREYWVNR